MNRMIATTLIALTTLGTPALANGPAELPPVGVETGTALQPNVFISTQEVRASNAGGGGLPGTSQETSTVFATSPEALKAEDPRP